MPVELLIVATVVVALDHVPPTGLPDNVVVDPVQADKVPDIVGFAVTEITPETVDVVVQVTPPFVTTQ